MENLLYLECEMSTTVLASNVFDGGILRKAKFRAEESQEIRVAVLGN
jgi:hypothetical protein